MWYIAWFLAWSIHIIWVLPCMQLTALIFRIDWDSKKAFVYMMCIWLCVVIVCGGCPASHLTDWIDVQAGWKQELAYSFDDSLAYQFIVRPLAALFA